MFERPERETDDDRERDRIHELETITGFHIGDILEVVHTERTDSPYLFALDRGELLGMWRYSLSVRLGTESKRKGISDILLLVMWHRLNKAIPVSYGTDVFKTIKHKQQP